MAGVRGPSEIAVFTNTGDEPNNQSNYLRMLYGILKDPPGVGVATLSLQTDAKTPVRPAPMLQRPHYRHPAGRDRHSLSLYDPSRMSPGPA